MEQIHDTSMLECFYQKFNMQIFFQKEVKKELRLFRYERNEYLCREGEELSYFLFFVHGKSKLFRSLPNGRVVLLAFYQPLSVIGDLEVVKNQAATCTLQALEECYCIGIPIEFARNELSKDVIFLRFLSESLAQKLYVISSNSSIHMIYPLENRLAGYLNETIFHNLYGEQCGEPFIEEQLTELSEFLGTSYRHLLRTFAQLCQKGVIRKEGNRYRVINRDLLQELAGDLYHGVTFMENSKMDTKRKDKKKERNN